MWSRSKCDVPLCCFWLGIWTTFAGTPRLHWHEGSPSGWWLLGSSECKLTWAIRRFTAAGSREQRLKLNWKRGRTSSSVERIGGESVLLQEGIATQPTEATAQAAMNGIGELFAFVVKPMLWAGCSKERQIPASLVKDLPFPVSSEMMNVLCVLPRSLDGRETRSGSVRDDRLKRPRDAVMNSKCESSCSNSVYFMMNEMTSTLDVIADLRNCVIVYILLCIS